MNFIQQLDILTTAKVESQLLLIFISIIIGLIIGAEREYQNKSAGLRTFILVSFGSCLFTILSIEIGVNNPDRIAANIITGIGFLGAGVIFKDDNKIGGITTATSIWATASLGMSIGSGHIYLGMFGMVLVLLILRILIYLQDYIDNRNKIRDYRIITLSTENYEYCQDLFKKYNLKYIITKQQSTQDNLATTWRITGRNDHHNQLISALMNNEKINAYQF